MFRTFLLIGFGIALLGGITTVVVNGSMESDLARIDAFLDDAVSQAAEVASLDQPTVESPYNESVMGEIVAAGSGVSLRTACDDDARVEGGLPERAVVLVVTEGEGTCLGWSLISYEPPTSGPISSWVRNEYLQIAGEAPPAGAPSIAAD